MAGFFLLHRGWRDSDVFCDEPVTEREAWVWLIEHAAWKDALQRGPKGERIEVKRGQFFTSLRRLEKQWGWGKNKVSRFLNRLGDFGMIGTVAGQSGCIITICNYDKYQDMRDIPLQESGTVAGQSRDTKEQGKQGKQENTSEDKSSSVGRAKPKSENWHRLPEGWTPTKPLPSSVAEKVADWPPGKIESELDSLRDWAKNASDVNGKGRKRDWDAAWHGWLRRADGDWRKRYGNDRISGNRGGGKVDGFGQALDEIESFGRHQRFEGSGDGGGGAGAAQMGRGGGRQPDPGHGRGDRPPLQISQRQPADAGNVR